MEQKQIGEFIQQLRKEKGLTQKDLADMINVSDKTISKWENGNSCPDTTLLSGLCNALDISVNELLSCTKLPPDDYSKKAEENIMTLLQEKENDKKKTLISYIIGGCLVVAGLLLSFGLLPAKLTWFIDLPTLVILAIYCVAAVILCGKKDKISRIHIARKVIMPAGLVVFLSGLMVTMGNLSDLSVLGPNMAVSLIALLYSSIAYIVLYIIEEHLDPAK